MNLIDSAIKTEEAIEAMEAVEAIEAVEVIEAIEAIGAIEAIEAIGAIEAIEAVEEIEGAGAYLEKLETAATSSEVNNLFSILAEAEREHHDALIELKEEFGPQRPQFNLLRGGACLFKTSPGKA